MNTARLTRVADTIIVSAPYNAELVAEIKLISGRRYDPATKAWSVPVGQADQAREIVGKYFPIEGEESSLEMELVHLIASACASAKRTYAGGVQIDGKDLINLSYGQICPGFEIISQKGGFVRGDGAIRHGRGHAWEVEYELVLRVRKGARIEATGRISGFCGSVEILPLSDAASPAECSVREAAARLGVAQSTIYRRIHAGKVAARRVQQASGRWQYMVQI